MVTSGGGGSRPLQRVTRVAANVAAGKPASVAEPVTGWRAGQVRAGAAWDRLRGRGGPAAQESRLHGLS